MYFNLNIQYYYSIVFVLIIDWSSNSLQKIWAGNQRGARAEEKGCRRGQSKESRFQEQSQFLRPAGRGTVVIG